MKPSILVLILLILCSCTRSGDNSPEEIVPPVPQPTFDGSLSDIEKYYTPELVEALHNLGFVIHTGSKPPEIEGIYEIAPSVIQASTTGIDSIGQRLSDQTLTLSNQNNDSLTIDFKIAGNGQTSLGKGSFISGNDDTFSIFIKSETQNEGYIAVETATAITGITSETGILNFQFAGLMLDDKSDPDNQYIENNTGRLIYDSDKASPEVGLINDQASRYQHGLLSIHPY